MNKKLSLMLAAFVAAGYSLTAEAGVIKVTGPVTNQSFIIASAELGTENAKVLVSEDGTLKAVDKTLADFATANAENSADYLFEFTKTSSKWYVTQGESYIRWTNTNFALGANSSQADLTWNAKNGLGYSASGTTRYIAPAEESGYSGSATPLSLYAISANVADVEEPAFFKVGDEFLVISTNAAGEAEVVLMNATELEIHLATNPIESAQWTVKDGIVTSAMPELTAKNIAGFEEGVFTLGETGEVVSVYNNKLYVGQAATDAASATSGVAETGVVAPTGIVSFEVGGTFLLKVGNETDVVAQDKSSNATLGEAADNAYWTISEDKKNPGVYKFTNNENVELSIDDVYEFKIESVGNAYNAFYLIDAKDEGRAVKYDATTQTFSWVSISEGGASAFGVAIVASSAYNAQELADKTGDGFYMTLKNNDTDKATTNLQGNPFVGKLRPVYPVDKDGKKVAANSGSVAGFKAYSADDNNAANYEEYLLANESGIIVLDLDEDHKWSVEGINEFNGAGGGFKFKTFSNADMVAILNAKSGDDAYETKQNVAYTFTITYKDSHKQDIDLIKVKGVSPANNRNEYRVISYNNASGYFLSAGLMGVGNPVYAVFGSPAMVQTTDAENNPLLNKYVNITLKTSNARNNNKVIAMNEDGNVAAVQASKFLFSKPEGQWAVTATEATVDEETEAEDSYAFTFTNRESGKSFQVENMYYLGDNQYAVYYNGSAKFSGYGSAATRDTLIIAPSAASELKNDRVQMDGYANFKAEDVLDTQYRLAVASTEETDFYVTENHSGKHLLGLTKEVGDAATWSLVPMTAARTYNTFGGVKTPTDSVYVFNTVGYYDSKDKYQEATDTLAMVSYVLQNTKNGEYLTYENPQTLDILSMICDPNSTTSSTKDLKEAYRFVLKEKQNGLYNVLGIKYNEKNHCYTLNLDNKLYGATTTKQGAVEVELAYDQVNSNDLFDLQIVDAPEYKLLDRGDTIRLFREENDYEVMYENGQFLNLGNIAQITDMAPALYVDTAYVNRGHNNRYQYLLVVNPKYVPELPCDIPGHPAVHPDTTYGRFLVNMIDTAYVAYTKGAIHTNKYINEEEVDEPYAKLSFVYGFHTGDKLYITDENYQKSNNPADVIDLSTRDFNVAKFAFRYVNSINEGEESAFKIQTGYYDYNSYIANDKRPSVAEDGYLKTVNGVVVVAKGYTKGEEFNLTAEASDPTANETITAEGAVSVVATDGAVTIKGAEGKNVVIATILGKVVANETINSDNETIAVPAGIAVVSVDGESFKVVVK
ncbi:hypothetical protein B5F77_01045 [Parabacteroides sp. An277]|uniref:DUF6383 domain-containing protein n=1 Tax=Parabacteroides sp. An277 TaxID=1965619 RepID=UPI000B37C460|nr:DUF6383 domain-containing protein [Parabacteroides sp. An277]OUO55471.1 hypothetical protein B5F77_01045 [Parabacteroides sp. An277]